MKLKLSHIRRLLILSCVLLLISFIYTHTVFHQNLPTSSPSHSRSRSQKVMKPEWGGMPDWRIRQIKSKMRDATYKDDIGFQGRVKLGGGSSKPLPVPKDRLNGALVDPIASFKDTGVGGAHPVRPFPSNSSVLVLALSFYADTAARDVIRETWASNHNNVYFVIGAPCPIPVADRVEYFCERDKPKNATSVEDQAKYDAEVEQIQRRVDAEQAKHQDLIRITDVHEAYRNLAAKLKAAYQWGILNTNATWFVKTDDDSFLRVATLSHHLLDKWPDGTVPRGIGAVKPAAIVDSTGERTSGRNKELKEYKQKTYPIWLAGNFGHAYSRSVAQYVSDNRASLWEGQGEDTSMGIWIDEAPKAFKEQMWWVNSLHFQGTDMGREGDCEDSDKFSIGHNISPEKMRKCYEIMDENEGIDKKLKALEGKIAAGLWPGEKEEKKEDAVESGLKQSEPHEQREQHEIKQQVHQTKQEELHQLLDDMMAEKKKEKALHPEQDLHSRPNRHQAGRKHSSHYRLQKNKYPRQR